jgi:hypothetical protein
MNTVSAMHSPKKVPGNAFQFLEKTTQLQYHIVRKPGLKASISVEMKNNHRREKARWNYIPKFSLEMIKVMFPVFLVQY